MLECLFVAPCVPALLYCRRRRRVSGLQQCVEVQPYTNLHSTGGGGGGAAAAVPAEKWDLTTQVPVLLEKDAEQPVYKDDSEYPEWLWALLEPTKTVQEQLMEGTDTLTPRQVRSLLKHARRELIKEGNLASSK